MTKYFQIRPAVSSKEIGKTYPQAGMVIDYDRTSNSSYTKVKPFEIPSFTPNFDFLILDKRAILTDLISGGLIPYGLLMNKRFKILLQQFNIQEHKFFNAIIKSQNESFYYYWLHFGKHDLIQKIDFANSQFILKQGIHKSSPIVLTSYSNYWDQIEANEYSIIMSNELIIEEVIKYDLFVMPFFDGGIYISNSLKNAIIESNITGIEINESSKIKSLQNLSLHITLRRMSCSLSVAHHLHSTLSIII